MDERYSGIQHVAMYLRKSRDEENRIEDGHITVLDKHRARLIEFIEKNKWTYDTYEEIGSSETVVGRKVFTRLLEKIAIGLYGAVVAVDLDRVTKGDRNDVGFINNIFHKANMPVITPNGGFFTFDEDDYMTDFKMLSSRIEQVNTKRRMREGKRDGVKVKGHWVNGPSPFGYKYNHDLKKLEKNPEQYEVFRFVVESYLSGMGIWKITQLLRTQLVKPPKGRTWHDNTILRMLQNQVYIGKVVFGKTTGSGHKNRGKDPEVIHNPEDRWIVYDNAHERLMTPEEFHDIQIKLMQNSRFPVHTKKSRQLLSGLLFCGKCGKAMTCNRREVKNGKKMYVKKCQAMSDTGVVCGNPGIEANDLYREIERRIKKFEEELKQYRNRSKDNSLKLLEKQITAYKKSIDNLENGFGRIRNMYRLGAITDEDFILEMKNNRDELEETQKTLREREKQYQYKSAEGRQDLRDRFDHFKKHFSFDDADTEKANELLKTIIDKIYYVREGDVIDLDVSFL